MSTITRRFAAPIVGSHFHPPAKLVIEALPAGCQLGLERDRENPYDPEAIKVTVVLGAELTISDEGLADRIAQTGFDLTELCQSDEPMMLGHVAASSGKPLGKRHSQGFSDEVGNQEIGGAIDNSSSWSAKLGFAGDGQALVLVESEE